MTRRGPRGRRLTGWRKLAGAAWRAPADPQFYGDLEIDAGALLEYQRELRDAGHAHVTITHLVGRGVARALRETPGMSVRIARGRQYPRESVDVFFIVSTDDGDNLTGVKVVDADKKDVLTLASEVRDSVAVVREGNDEAFGKVRRMLDLLPPRVLRPALNLGSWLTSDLDLDLPRLGMRRESFGGAMITSVGMWGVTRAYSPLASYYRVPVLVLVGAVTQRPVAVAGQVLVRPMLTLTATFDHRYVDGAHAARFAQAVGEYLRDPSKHEGAAAVDTNVVPLPRAPRVKV
ncbi:MAG TPA: 2-oxo acid dehydrogenase subunit E2 [Nocardioidaceae bacterium]|nr:2-oxo acid dehydrogenase subunit E2 [Nocardioidaceae bacterium]